MDTSTSSCLTSPLSPAWAGLDVAKNSFEAAVVCTLPEGDRTGLLRSIPVESFPRTAEGAARFVAWARRVAGQDTPVRAVMEATGRYSTELAVWLAAQCPEFAPAIINPETAHAYTKSLAVRNKTDARALALYGADRRPAAYEPPSPALAELKELSRQRVAVSDMRVAEENRAQEPSVSPAVRRSHLSIIKHLLSQERRLEQAMRKIIEAVPELKRDVEQLDAIYGVGFLTAAAVLAELGDLRRFQKARQMTAFAGVSPSRADSGTSVRHRTRMAKKGSSHVRRALYLAALSIVRGQNDLADDYRRLVNRGKKKMEALGVVMRKLLVLMRAVLLSGQPWQKHYQKTGARTCGKTCGKTVQNPQKAAYICA